MERQAIRKQTPAKAKTKKEPKEKRKEIEKKNKRPMDFVILITVIILVCFGIIMVYDSSYYYAQIRLNNSLYYFNKQLIGAILGLAAMMFFAYFDYRKLRKFKYLAMGVSIALLVLVLFTGTKLGASRWLDVAGISIQPSEIAKFSLILFLADSIANNKRMKSFKYGILPYIILIGIVCGLIILQPNFSMVINICLLVFVMLFVGGARGRHLTFLAGSGVAAGVGLMIAAPYRMKRFLIFLDPFQDPLGDGFQLVQSLYAVGSGGLFGVGFGNGHQKYLYLLYAESDFIFSIIIEELGLIGAIVVLCIFGVLIYRGIKVALTCPDMFGALLATGIIATIGIQTAIHVAVVTGSIPPTGLTLPFISAGSSSLIMCMASIGILLNISKHTTKA